MAHILPHWTWPERVGLVTPVHVFSAASEAELFVHGKSLGRKKKMELEYRFRWDDVVYEPGEVRVVVYTANGTLWAEDAVRTAGSPFGLEVDVDRNVIAGDGNDLSFITVRVVDKDRVTVPQGDNKVRFEVEEAAAELVATDNGDPTDMTPFPEAERKAFNGLVLGIVRSKGGESGLVSVRVTVEGLESASLSVEVQ
jgi:beta-galactosidase